MGKYLGLLPLHETVISISLNAIIVHVPNDATAGVGANGDDTNQVTSVKACALSRIFYTDFVHLLLSPPHGHHLHQYNNNNHHNNNTPIDARSQKHPTVIKCI